MDKPGNLIFVIFGASGDLTYRKIIPSLYSLKAQNLMPERFAIIGVSLTPLTTDTFREKMKEGIKYFADKRDYKEEEVNSFLQQLSYVPLKSSESDEVYKLKTLLTETDKKLNTENNYIFYLAVPSVMFGVIAANLGKVGLNDQSVGCKRILVEKPFGNDLDSAKKLNKEMLEFFNEEHIYRIDHYLGKESVQNLFVTRFANGIFEPLWNRNYINHVEITSAESIGIEHRGRYYESAGALRDIIQNHLLQEVSLMAMEPTSSLDPEAIRNEKLKVIQSLRPIKEEDVEKYVIRGQYTSSTIKGQYMKAYREEADVAQDSRTETYVAMKFYIDNWRWGGIPFYIRTGKRLPAMVNEIVIHFKSTPHLLFLQDKDTRTFNQLVIRIQPDEGMLLKFLVKLPGKGYRVKNVDMGFYYKDLTDIRIPSAYERLLYDAMLGDSTLFLRADSVEASWKFVMPVLNAWNNNPEAKVIGYPAGTWGPSTADNLIEGEDTGWRHPCKNLTDEDVYCEL
jgi:glucose-6-phosphate 1-dehydrogenase